MKSFLQHVAEQSEKQLKALRAADAADLKDLPGKAGETAHRALHKTIKNILKEAEEETAKDGDYAGAPGQTPMSEPELELYYQSWLKGKQKPILKKKPAKELENPEIAKMIGGTD